MLAQFQRRKIDYLKSQDNLIAESIFKVFDDDNSGTFTFEEFYQVDVIVQLLREQTTFNRLG